MSEDRIESPQSNPDPSNSNRREAIVRFAKYTAPAVLAMLISNSNVVIAVSEPK